MCLVPQLTVLQDLLDLVLFVFIDFHRWDVGGHSIMLEGLQEADVEDVMNALTPAYASRQRGPDGRQLALYVQSLGMVLRTCRAAFWGPAVSGF